MKKLLLSSVFHPIYRRLYMADPAGSLLNSAIGNIDSYSNGIVLSRI